MRAFPVDGRLGAAGGAETPSLHLLAALDRLGPPPDAAAHPTELCLLRNREIPQPQLIAAERHFDVLLLQTNGDQLFHQMHRNDDPGSAGRLDRLSELRHDRLHLPILLVLVGEATQQAAADSGDLRRVERQVLVLGHAHGDFGEGRKPRRAAERPPASPQSTEQSCFVSRPNLAQLYPTPQLFSQGGRQAMKLARIRRAFPVRDRIVEVDRRPIKRMHSADRLDPNVLGPSTLAKDANRVCVAAAIRFHAFEFLGPHSAQRAARLTLQQCASHVMRRDDNLTGLFTPRGGDDHPIADNHVVDVGSKVIDAPGITEPDANDAFRG